jgi:hypothetical protein
MTPVACLTRFITPLTSRTITIHPHPLLDASWSPGYGSNSRAMGGTHRSNSDDHLGALFYLLRRSSSGPFFLGRLFPFHSLGRTHPPTARGLRDCRRSGSNWLWIPETSTETCARAASLGLAMICSGAHLGDLLPSHASEVAVSRSRAAAA